MFNNINFYLYIYYFNKNKIKMSNNYFNKIFTIKNFR